jgi:cyclophilin family peptidyl-prolyl cis-trans isomerase
MGLSIVEATTLRPVLRSLALLACLALVLASCGGGDDDKKVKSDSGAKSGSDSASTQTSQGCKRVSAPAPKPDGKAKEPKGSLDPAKTYEVKMDTNCGSFTIRLDQKTSPKTAASFVSLVRSGFYDDLTFHRIVPGFVIQGGDPTGSGGGGPGYSTVDRPPAGTAYTHGVVAMAKTGQEAPGTAGSQFYVVTGADAGLPPEYALLGKVVAGLDVTAAIEKLGDPAAGEAGTPLQPVVISKATVSES